MITIADRKVGLFLRHRVQNRKRKQERTFLGAV